MNYRYLSAIAAATLTLGMSVPSTSALSHRSELPPAPTTDTKREISQRRYTYEIHLVGIACYQESNHVWGATNDDPFVVINSVDARGALTDTIFPQGNLYLSNINQGDVRRFSNTLVWRGAAQRVSVSAQLWEYDNAERKAVRTFADISDIAAAVGAGIGTIATGGAGGVAFVTGAAAINQLNNKVRSELEDRFHDHMGTYTVDFQLDRVGSLADRPQYKMRSVRYDMATDHRGDGAHYKLLWEVRRY